MIYQKWQHNQPKAVLLLVHGLGAHPKRWEFLSEFFLNHEISSYALALQGFGQTQGQKGHIETFNTYFDDIKKLYQIIKTENLEKDIFLVGESLGALISFLFVILEPGYFSGLICISPSFKSCLKFNFSFYANVFFSLIFNPKKQFKLPFTPQMCTRDIEYQKIIDTDPLDYRFASAKFLFNIIWAQLKAGCLKDKFNTPVLFLLSGKDRIIDSKKSREIFQKLKVKDKTLIEYPEMFHSLSIDLEKERVFTDILKWVKKKIEPLT